MFRLLIVIFLTVFFLVIDCSTSLDNTSSNNPDYVLIKKYNLPEELDETSGILLFDSLIWTFNDSESEPVIYGFVPGTGEIIRKIIISNGINNDWEDIAQNKNCLFIGDIGNNDGSRKDLKIYILPKSQISQDSIQHVMSDSINFSYSNQVDYNPALYANRFDCEAMIAMNDSLYLFSKDWLHLKTSIYSLPVQAGTYKAKYLRDFDSDGLVTGADLNPENNSLVLCGYNLFYPFIILLDNMNNLKVLQKNELEELPGTQVEGITFEGNNSFFITNENSAILQSLHEVIFNAD